MQDNTRKGIRVTVDEAAAFDMLAILATKKHRLGVGLTAVKALNEEICEQIGYELVEKIITSPENEALIEANLALFDGVEKVRHGEGMSAKEFDDLNQARHRAKQALQKRFWNNELTEVKT